MDSSLSLVLYAAVFIGVLLTFEGFMQLFVTGRGDEQSINRRLRLLSSGADPEEILQLLRRRREQTWLDRLPVLRRWPSLVVQSGIKLKPATLFSILSAAFAGLVVLFLILGFGWPLATLLAATLAYLLPWLLLSIKRGQRVEALRRQMPDAIDLIARSLRAGFPLSSSFSVIAREMPDPIGTEFGIIADAITYGDTINDAIVEFVDRVEIEEAAYLAVAVNVQAGTGGNLAQVLEALSSVIRERFAMLRKIKAVSAEAKLTSWVVSAAPVLIFAGLNLVAPSYYGDVADHPLYKWFLAIGVILTIINALVLNRLVRFRF
jgi:tight adherence protein B